MSKATIYLVHPEGGLTPMRPSAPADEDTIQALIAKHPDLIAEDEGGLLLIQREQPIADEIGSAGRWSLDHLFVTRDAIPVLVEVKRATDTRLRREVVGQLLDYAANGVAHWTPGTIAAAFAKTCEIDGKGADAHKLLREFAGDDAAEGFWERIDANFAAGNIKLVFCADVIPRELAKVVEFLNEQMRAEVRAVELSWHSSESKITTLVPRIIGDTQRAASEKAKAKAVPPLTIEEWIAKHFGPRSSDAVAGAQNAVELLTSLGCLCLVTKAQGSIAAETVGADGSKIYPFHLARDGGKFTVSFDYTKSRPALKDEAVRADLLQKFNAAVGPLDPRNLGGFPGIPAARLSDPSVVDRLRPVAKHYLALARAANMGPAS